MSIADLIKRTKWQRCVRCGQEVFTTSLPEETFCGGNYCLEDAPKYTGSKYSKKADIPDAIRWEVWERDNFTCQHCGSRRFLTIDHIHPESKGGTLDLDNLQTLCHKCNSSKGAR